MQLSLYGGIGRGQFELVLLVVAGQGIGLEGQSVHVERLDLIKTRALEDAVGITGVDTKAVEASSLGIGVERDLVDVMQTELLDLHGDPSGGSLLQRHL